MPASPCRGRHDHSGLRTRDNSNKFIPGQLQLLYNYPKAIGPLGISIIDNTWSKSSILNAKLMHYKPIGKT